MANPHPALLIPHGLDFRGHIAIFENNSPRRAADGEIRRVEMFRYLDAFWRSDLSRNPSGVRL